MTIRPNGTHPHELASGVHYDMLIEPAWSPKGSQIAVAANTMNQHEHYDVWVIDVWRPGCPPG